MWTFHQLFHLLCEVAVNWRVESWLGQTINRYLFVHQIRSVQLLASRLLSVWEKKQWPWGLTFAGLHQSCSAPRGRSRFRVETRISQAAYFFCFHGAFNVISQHSKNNVIRFVIHRKMLREGHSHFTAITRSDGNNSNYHIDRAPRLSANGNVPNQVYIRWPIRMQLKRKQNVPHVYSVHSRSHRCSVDSLSWSPNAQDTF